jgi:hypothetical protein
MASIIIPDHLLHVTGGQREHAVSAATFRDLLVELEERFPGSQSVLARCAVAIDGQIFQDAFLEPLDERSEVFFMQRIEGG